MTAFEFIRTVIEELDSDAPDYAWIAKVMTKDKTLRMLFAALVRAEKAEAELARRDGLTAEPTCYKLISPAGHISIHDVKPDSRLYEIGWQIIPLHTTPPAANRMPDEVIHCMASEILESRAEIARLRAIVESTKPLLSAFGLKVAEDE